MQVTKLHCKGDVMLKRLWIVVSVLWDIPFLALLIYLLGSSRTSQDNDVWPIMLAVIIPWAVGLILWASWRFIRGGRSARTEIQPY